MTETEQISEKVAFKLGYTKSRAGTRYYVWQDKDGKDVSGWSAAYGVSSSWEPRYAEDLKQAWEIVEQPRIWCVLTKVLRREFGTSKLTAGYECEIWKEDGDPQKRVVADTPAMAICQAFLRLQ